MEKISCMNDYLLSSFCLALDVDSAVASSNNALTRASSVASFESFISHTCPLFSHTEVATSGISLAVWVFLLDIIITNAARVAPIHRSVI